MGRIIVTGKWRARMPRRGAEGAKAGGFTLMELLIVITIIVVLAGIAISMHATSVRRAKEAVLRENVFRLRDSLDQYYADKGSYPPDLATLVTENYMRQIPRDPFTESADTWQIEMSEADPYNPDAAPGIRDVKSGAQGIALDGSNYADW